jgi:hypothetical protein
MAFDVTTDDIEAMWRVLDDDETDVAQTRLDQAQAKLRVLRPGLEAALAAIDLTTPKGPQQKADLILLIKVALCEAVIRFLRNPDVTQNQQIGADGSIGISYDTDAGSGIYIDQSDLIAIDSVLQEVAGNLPSRVKSARLVSSFPWRRDTVYPNLPTP